MAWATDWSTNWSTDLSTDWSTDLSTDLSTDWSTDLSTDLSTDWPGVPEPQIQSSWGSPLNNERVERIGTTLPPRRPQARMHDEQGQRQGVKTYMRAPRQPSTYSIPDVFKPESLTRTPVDPSNEDPWMYKLSTVAPFVQPSDNVVNFDQQRRNSATFSQQAGSAVEQGPALSKPYIPPDVRGFGQRRPKAASGVTISPLIDDVSTHEYGHFLRRPDPWDAWEDLVRFPYTAVHDQTVHRRPSLRSKPKKAKQGNQSEVLPLDVNGGRSAQPSKTQVVAELQAVDLTGKVTKRDQFAAHGGSYADVFVGDYRYGPGSQDNRKVAIKVLRTHIWSKENKEKVQKRVSREIRLWAPLKHPNVLPLLGFVRNIGSELAMVSPWMDDGNLAEYLDTNRETLDAGKRIRICEEIANGLCYIHSQNIIHGDLSTGNVFMHHGVAKLGDFGLSNVIAELQGASFLTSKVGGSARWAAPELFLIDGSTPELTVYADIYSFGNIMFHVLSGKVPYQGLKEHQIIPQHLSDTKPPRPSESPFLTDEYWELINHCWERVPTSRPSSDQIGQLLRLKHRQPTPT